MLPENGAPVHHNGRLIGTIHRGELWQTRRPNNFLKWAISFDVGVLAEVERLGADRVRIRNGETNEIFTASIAAIRQFGREIDHGYGRQIALPWAYWQRSGATHHAAQPPQRQTQFDDLQPTLFEAAS